MKLESSMKKEVKKDFLDLFRPISKMNGEEKAPNLNFYVLKSRNGEFIYDFLKDSIAENIVPYALSRKQYASYKNYDSKPYLKAVKKLLDQKNNTGELGEILLFSFLESDLNAPKIATKLELKTSSNEYVKGSDGIHLLNSGNNSFQLIFGESKTLSAKPTTAITEAINSIHDFKTRSKNNIHDEINLIQIHLDKEFDQETSSFIKKLLIPTETPEDTSVDYSFGIFIGTNIDIDSDIRKQSQEDFNKYLDEMLLPLVDKLATHLNKKLIEKELSNHKFYVYILPLENIADTRISLLPTENGE